MITAIACLALPVVAALIVFHRSTVEHAVDTAVLRERRRVSAYLRRQAHIAEQVAKCTELGSRGQAEERYASAVLDETAREIDEKAHYAEVVR